MIVAAIGLALFGIAAPFALYPLALFLRAWLAPRPIAAADNTPAVELIICAHNEASSIGPRLDNALALDYPTDLLSICVASDGSTDGTVEIARIFSSDRVRVLDLPRKGKAYALDQAVRSTQAEVLAFSDANSEWTRPALRALMRPLADPEVGGVAGDQRYRSGTAIEESVPSDTSDASGPSVERDSAIGERSYWSFDRWLKRWQSQAGSAISATGAIYAIRRALFEPPPPDATDDFMISTGVIAQGRRLVFCEEAIAIEPPAKNNRGEFRRKVRITTRGLRAVYYRRALLNPAHHGAYALELFVHKLWRRLTWIPLLALVLLAPLCWGQGGVLAMLAFGVVGAVAMGIVGLIRPDVQRFKPIALASYAIMVNAACAVATIDVLRGRRVAHWEPARASSEAPGRAS
jgi:cellulose synthase/poly-beta-1,6-N-acetylglucosamine synthase-like glycosyltransferase